MYIELIVMYTVGTLIMRRSKNNYLRKNRNSDSINYDATEI